MPAKVKPEEIKLAKQVIETFERPLDLADYKDEYREGLQRIIDAKIAGEEVVAPAVEAPPKVVNLMDALKKSLDAVSAGEEEAGEGWPRESLPRPSAREPKSGIGIRDQGSARPSPC